MKRELGIARCGLACCLCSENAACPGCEAEGCPGAAGCENRRCSLERGLAGCRECGDAECRKGLLAKIKPRGFNLFARKYGYDALLDCLERNEARGVIYHRRGVEGDYDDFTDIDSLLDFIRTGSKRQENG